MAFCAKCGASVPVGAKFCSSCGSPISNNAQSSSSSSVPGSQVASTSSQQHPIVTVRPTGVTVLAILAILSGIATILSGIGIGLLSIATRVVTNSSGQVISTPNYGAGAAIGILFVLFALLAIVQFIVAYGFLVGASWSWWVGMIVAVLSVISILGLNVIGFALGIIMLYYLTRPRVKAWFHQF